MFDFLEGRIAEAAPTRLVLAVGGAEGTVGYACRVPVGTRDRLERLAGGLVRLYTLPVAQDDLPRLLGFATKEERELCRLLLRLPGVGPSLVLGLLSAGGPERLLRALRDEDLGFLRSIKGIGPKTARRLCLEAKDRAAAWLQALGRGSGTIETSADPAAADAVLALVSLGFERAEAEARVAAARAAQPEAPVEDLVKAALRGPETTARGGA